MTSAFAPIALAASERILANILVPLADQLKFIEIQGQTFGVRSSRHDNAILECFDTWREPKEPPRFATAHVNAHHGVPPALKRRGAHVATIVYRHAPTAEAGTHELFLGPVNVQKVSTIPETFPAYDGRPLMLVKDRVAALRYGAQ